MHLSSGDIHALHAAVLLEGMRIVRCDDSPINSVVAAGAASYILVSSHSALLALSLRLVAQSSSLALPLNVALTICDAASFACYARHRTPGKRDLSLLEKYLLRGARHYLPRLRNPLHRSRQLGGCVQLADRKQCQQRCTVRLGPEACTS